jgi:hypothetical protein
MQLTVLYISPHHLEKHLPFFWNPTCNDLGLVWRSLMRRLSPLEFIRCNSAQRTTARPSHLLLSRSWRPQHPLHGGCPEIPSGRPLGGKRWAYGYPSVRWWAKKEYGEHKTAMKMVRMQRRSCEASAARVATVEGRSGDSNTDRAGHLDRWPFIPLPRHLKIGSGGRRGQFLAKTSPRDGMSRSWLCRQPLWGSERNRRSI